MNLKYAYVFVPLLIILAVYLHMDLKKREPGKEADMAGRVGFDAAEVAVIEIRNEDRVIRIVRRIEGFYFESPLNTPADQDAVNRLLDAVVNAKVGRDLGPLEDFAKAEYGLDKPVYRMDVLGEGGKILLTFRMGHENPTGDGRYVTMGIGELLLLSPKEIAFTEVGFNDLRSRDILDFDSDTITAFEVSTNEVDYAFELDGDLWYLTKPQRFKASGDWCRDLFTLIGKRAKVQEFISDPGFKGLVPLSGGIRLLEKDGTEHIIRFLGVDTIKGVLAESSYQAGAFLTEFGLETFLDRTLEELRETRLILLAKSQIDSVVFREVGGDNLRFKRGNGGFVITKPEGRHKYEQSDFDTFFNAVLNVAPLRFVDSYDTLEELGLEPFWIRIELYKKDKAENVELYIGKKIEDVYYASINKSEQVFVISKDEVDSILRAVNKLR